MIPRKDVSLRKIRRKLSHDGLSATVVSGIELVSRKRLFTPIFRRLVASNRIKVLSEMELLDAAEQTYFVASKCGDEPAPVAGGPVVTGTGEGYVLSTTGTGLTSRGDIIGETVSEPGARTHKTAVVLGRHAFHDGPKLVYNVVRRRTDMLDKRVIRIGAASPLIPRYRNYFHWTIECLPRLRALRDFEERTGEDVSLLVPSDLPGWIAESLRLVCYDDADVVPAESKVYRTSNLVVTSFPEPTRADCRWVRKTVLRNVSAEKIDISTGNNVYISRANAMERRVLNEADVEETLAEYGFRSYVLEELSVAEQAQIFSDADLVVGAHGAGLSNLIYCEDAGVLELFGSKVKSNFARLCEIVGLTYESLECEPSGVDLVVDTNRLAGSIDKLAE